MSESDELKASQRLKLLYLRDIFLRHTSDSESLTRSQISDLLLEEYGISEGRKAFGEDIEALRSYGMDIQWTNGRTAAYRLSSREFELAELKLLADAVSSAKFLTIKQSETLLNKLGTLCSENEAQQLSRTVYVNGRVKQSNKGVLYNADTINHAISTKPLRKIQFRYFDYDLAKHRRYRDGMRVCSPYALVWDSEHYYLVAWNDRRDCMSSYRVDRMEDVELTEQPARPLPRGFDMEDYVAAHISMFSGEKSELKLRFDKSLVNAVLDRFGTGVRLIKSADSESFTIHISVAAQPPFFAWLFQFGDKAELVAPESARRQYLEMLENVAVRHRKAGE